MVNTMVGFGRAQPFCAEQKTIASPYVIFRELKRWPSPIWPFYVMNTVRAAGEGINILTTFSKNDRQSGSTACGGRRLGRRREVEPNVRRRAAGAEQTGVKAMMYYLSLSWG